MSEKSYSKELKVRVAKEALQPENERAAEIIAAKYGILPRTVTRWKEIYREYGEEGFKKNGKRRVTNSRIKDLEKENAELKEEIEILKKAAAFLANIKRD